MKKYKLPVFAAAFVLVFALTCWYFLRIKTSTIYGDDLVFYRDHFKLNTLLDRITCIRTGEKFRPVFGLISNYMIDIFGKKMYMYFLFNVGVQTVITFLFALIANLFLESPVFSLFVALLVGLSRFAFFNITQLYCGGPLEGIAMIFFLLTLYFIAKVFAGTGYTSGQNYRNLLYAVLAANLAIYTHERYLVLLPFIMLVALLYPFKGKLAARQKIVLCLLPALSVAINVVIKKYIFGFHFFVGTGGTHIRFSPSMALGFLCDGLLSVLQINSGPQYLTGMPYASLLPVFQKIVIVIVLCLVVIFVLYLVNVRRYFKTKNEKGIASFYTILFLFVILFMCMAPAIVTIRLEQRWLQASFSVFMLIVVIAFCNIKARRKAVKYVLFSLFVILFFYSDRNYLYTGTDHFFMKETAESTACLFKEAIYNDRIKKSIDRLYIDEGHRHENYEVYLGWIIADGFNFDYYQGKAKKIIYIDSLKYTDPEQVAQLKDFNRETDQVIYIREDIMDATDEYLQGRSKFLSSEVKQ
jgi:hypothetical protein